MSPKKHNERVVTQEIRLKPSPSDYVTWVKMTSKVLGETGPASLKTKPSERVMKLAGLAS